MDLKARGFKEGQVLVTNSGYLRYLQVDTVNNVGEILGYTVYAETWRPIKVENSRFCAFESGNFSPIDISELLTGLLTGRIKGKVK